MPDHLATLTPAVEGHVHKLLVSQGDSVKNGQPIVELDRAVAQADLAEKTATRDGLRASLVLLQSLPRPEERKANELTIEQAKVAVEQAKVAAERLRPLLSRHEVSQEQLFDAERAVKQAVIQQEMAEATLHATMIGPRPEAVAEAEGKIKTADALVAFSRAHLEYHTIRAADRRRARQPDVPPRADDRHRQPDRRSGRYAAGFRVGLDPAPVDLVVARRANGAVVRPADAGSPSSESSPLEKDEMAGKVAFVGRVADPQTGNLPIRVLVNNHDGRLTIGESVRVSIVLEERPNVLQVPAAAVLDLGEGPVLSVVRDGKSVVLHAEAGTPHRGWVEVAGTDLKPGELVIVEGGYNLPERTPVKLVGKEDKRTRTRETLKPRVTRQNLTTRRPSPKPAPRRKRNHEPRRGAGRRAP